MDGHMDTWFVTTQNTISTAPDAGGRITKSSSRDKIPKRDIGMRYSLQ